MAKQSIKDFTISSGKIPRENPSPAGEGTPTPARDRNTDRYPEFQYPPDGKPGSSNCQEK